MKPERLSELLRSVKRDNPRASEAEVRDLCWTAICKDPTFNRPLFDYWFGNSYRDFAVIGGASNSIAVISVARERNTGSPASEPENVDVARARRAETREAVNALKACLMDHALSSGVLLRFATFGDAAREGGWLSDIAKLGKPNEIIGKKLTDANLQDIRQRHYARNAKVA
jgi:hypothetical protein